jgi:hypothetical protein
MVLDSEVFHERDRGHIDCEPILVRKGSVQASDRSIGPSPSISVNLRPLPTNRPQPIDRRTRWGAALGGPSGPDPMAEFVKLEMSFVLELFDTTIPPKAIVHA